MEFTKEIEFNTNPTVDQELVITYNGFLANSDALSIVYGFGENWEHTTEIEMTKIDNNFVAKIKMLDFSIFNFCFKNSNNEWDNNSYSNYITPIQPAISQGIDIDALIDEILQPVNINIKQETEEVLPVQVFTSPIDLGEEISNALSNIEDYQYEEDACTDFLEANELLLSEVISSNSLEDFEDIDKNITTEETPAAIEIENNEINQETGIIPTKDTFLISPRKLSGFYLFRKRVKLALYKTLIKIPKLIFGSEEN